MYNIISVGSYISLKYHQSINIVNVNRYGYHEAMWIFGNKNILMKPI